MLKTMTNCIVKGYTAVKLLTQVKHEHGCKQIHIQIKTPVLIMRNAEIHKSYRL